MGRGHRRSHAEKRQALLEAATALIAERGPDVSLAEISNRSRVSRQTIYNQYGDKNGLLKALTARSSNGCPCWPEEPSGDPETALAAYAASLLRWAHQPIQVMTLRVRRRRLENAGLDREGSFDAPVPRLEAYLRSEARLGRVKVVDAHAAAIVFLDLVLDAAQLRIVLGERTAPSVQEIEAEARRCTDLFVRGCLEVATHAPNPPRPPRETDRAITSPHAP